MASFQDQRDVSSWLALWRMPFIGPSHFFKLLKHFKTPQNVLAASSQELTALGISAKIQQELKSPAWKAVATDVAWLNASPDHHIILWEDSNYPGHLREIANPPPLLFVRGDVDLLQQPQLAMVGSRNPTHAGLEHAAFFARELVNLGLVVTSGLALGIDAASHRGALAAQGKTIAVLGTGIDIVYPKRHEKLADEILQQGAIVSEFPPGVPPVPENFPRRNRIISGLSYGVLVVEAQQKSGSLITARYALEQGREVFALPGSLENPLARGCHHLIRQGGKLVETVQDILEELPNYLKSLLKADISSKITANSQLNLEKEHMKLLHCIGFEPIPVDLIVARSGLVVQEVLPLLLELELQGIVITNNVGRYQRRL